MKEALTRMLRFCLGVAMVVVAWLLLIGLVDFAWTSRLPA